MHHFQHTPKLFYRAAIHWIEGLNRQEWIVVLVVGAAFGFLCMRGFGSRKYF